MHHSRRAQNPQSWEPKVSLAGLPNFKLSPAGEIGSRFIQLGLRDYHAAAGHVWRLPYGRNSERANFALVLEENLGTCSTKHALLAQLAHEHAQPVFLVLGIYEMDENNTPGVGAALQRYGLASVPEAHCYLLHETTRLDLTHHSKYGLPAAEMLWEEKIEPHQIGAHKVNVHRDFLRAWAAQRRLDFEHVWRAREACIAALARRDTAQRAGFSL